MDVKDCKTIDDIVLYLVSSLQFININVQYKDWKQVLGFRRAMMIHQVWYNKESGLWAFHVSDQDDFNENPNMGTYTSLTNLLHKVSEHYKTLWTIK